MNLGNPPERVDCVLSTERLAGIIDYEPTDLVLSVGAGARFGDVQAVLGEHGQRLPLDPPGGADATIGGLIATGRWGPLRYSAGTLRDLLIGIAVAHPSGTVSKAGGMVVKNVSGFDMPRLYHGSLGTLGVIVSANFKVLPRPRAEATVIARLRRAGEGILRGERTARRPRTSRRARGRLPGRTRGTWRRASKDETKRLPRSRRGSARSRAETSRELKDRERQLVGVLCRQATSGRTSNCGPGPLRRAAERDRGSRSRMASGAERHRYRDALPCRVTWAGHRRGPAGLRHEGSSASLAEVQGVLLGLADTATILAAPPAWKQGIDVWGRLPEGFEVMRSLREQFDPQRTINPGRFAGFL